MNIEEFLENPKRFKYTKRRILIEKLKHPMKNVEFMVDLLFEDSKVFVYKRVHTVVYKKDGITIFKIYSDLDEKLIFNSSVLQFHLDSAPYSNKVKIRQKIADLFSLSDDDKYRIVFRNLSDTVKMTPN